MYGGLPTTLTAFLRTPLCSNRQARPKSASLKVAVGGEQHVLGLEVAMGDALAVHVAHGADELRQVEVGNVLADADVGLDLVEEIAPPSASSMQIHT